MCDAKLVYTQHLTVSAQHKINCSLSLPEPSPPMATRTGRLCGDRTHRPRNPGCYRDRRQAPRAEVSAPKSPHVRGIPRTYSTMAMLSEPSTLSLCTGEHTAFSVVACGAQTCAGQHSFATLRDRLPPLWTKFLRFVIGACLFALAINENVLAEKNMMVVAATSKQSSPNAMHTPGSVPLDFFKSGVTDAT